MEKITAKELVDLSGMYSSNPENYSSRGARVHDLDGEKLAKIYQKIKEEIGAEAAEAFSLMVKNIKYLSAKKFLESFYALEKNGWVYSEETQNAINEKSEFSGPMATVYEYHASKRNDTDYIRDSYFALINGRTDLRYLRYENFLRTLHSTDGDFFNEDDDYDDGEEYE